MPRMLFKTVPELIMEMTMMYLLILHRTSFHFTFGKSLVGLKLVAMCHFQRFLYNSTALRTLGVSIIRKSITNYFILFIYLSLRVCSFIYSLFGEKKITLLLSGIHVVEEREGVSTLVDSPFSGN